MTAVHVAGIRPGEVVGSGAHADLLHDDVGAVAVAGDQQPGVVGAELIAAAVPAETGVRYALGDRTGDLEAERAPGERNTLAELAGRVVDVTSLALEYQVGQAAAMSLAQMFSAGASITMALCANRSAWPGSRRSGQ